ncbi:histidine--tRNA ligase [Paenibacillus endoradicis]|uniref:histidine--tRNA ligase n=1 Tax=Paenibacillus endoradicis TaxID=2972487 RepID=UPI0021597E47|nr:histidine--tRNA ligase [Paenibacillus endoradicis]MCR8655751.1 histidine--tRNA ligase [Paenibacillus endoradicis]MCR8658077.1 histidine--tRNA ligase [Paenibacillus endoradicis]
MSFKKSPGTQDILPGSVEKWQFVEQKAREICSRYNFREIRTPIFESTELFQRGVGETTDIVEKEMYTFIDRGERSLTLRPEGTAGVVRSFVENKLFGEPDLTKLYYMGPMFRYERPQAGRYRQFHQFGIEAIGAADPALDAEVIALGYTFYTEVGLRGVGVEINSVGTPAVRGAFREKLLTYLEPKREILCKDCQSRIDRNPLRVLDCKVDQKHFTDAPSILDSLDEECQIHFDKVKQHLSDMEIPFEINHRLVRGLDYYTHTAFEFKAEGIGAIDTVGGGGRYNGLVADVGGPDQPGVGFGLGLERTVLLLEHQETAIPNLNELDVYLIALGEEADRQVTKLVYQLRKAGVKAERDYQGRKMKAQMKSADRLQARYTAILGDDELANGEITLKEMATGLQRKVSFSDLSHVIMESKLRS